MIQQHYVKKIALMLPEPGERFRGKEESRYFTSSDDVLNEDRGYTGRNGTR